MAKRRTRKQKRKAMHSFMSVKQNVKGEYSLETSKSEPNVKRQIKSSIESEGLWTDKNKYLNNMAKAISPATIKTDIIRSIIQATAILSLELVLYFVLKFQII